RSIVGAEAAVAGAGAVAESEGAGWHPASRVAPRARHKGVRAKERNMGLPLENGIGTLARPVAFGMVRKSWLARIRPSDQPFGTVIGPPEPNIGRRWRIAGS